jgi:hypothetical protein
MSRSCAKNSGDFLRDRRFLALSLLALAACGRVGGPAARLEFAEHSSASLVSLNDECHFARGNLGSYSASSGHPGELYSSEEFSGYFSDLARQPVFTAPSGQTSFSIPVAPSVRTILYASGYLLQETPSSLNCNRRGDPAQLVHRMVFPVAGQSDAQTFDRTLDVALTLKFGKPLRLVGATTSTGIPTQPSTTLGMRTLYFPGTFPTGETIVAPPASPTLTYAVITDLTTGITAYALPFRNDTLSTAKKMRETCGVDPVTSGAASNWTPCLESPDFIPAAPFEPPLLTRLDVLDLRSLKHIASHYVSPLLPGRSYRILWAMRVLGTGGGPPTCKAEVTVTIPFGPKDEAITLSPSDLGNCASAPEFPELRIAVPSSD